MPWATIIALLVPIIVECFNKDASEEIIKKRLRNPKQRHVMLLRRRLVRKMRRENPDIKRKERRALVDMQLDMMIDAGRNATDADIEEIMEAAKQ